MVARWQLLPARKCFSAIPLSLYAAKSISSAPLSALHSPSATLSLSTLTAASASHDAEFSSTWFDFLTNPLHRPLVDSAALTTLRAHLLCSAALTFRGTHKPPLFHVYRLPYL